MFSFTINDKFYSYLTPNVFLGNTVTVMSPDGKPIQVNPMALQAAATQNAVAQGMFNI